MDITLYIYKGILLSHKNEWNLAICNDMDGPRGYNAKWNKSVRERRKSDFTHKWNLINKTGGLAGLVGEACDSWTWGHEFKPMLNIETT